MKKIIKYCFRIEPGIYENLLRTAEKEGISEDTVVCRALENYFKDNDPYSFLNQLSHSKNGKVGMFYEIRQLEFEKAVKNFHPDIREILFGENRTQFIEWLKNQPVFLQKHFRDTDDPEEAADIITRFKSSVQSDPSVPSVKSVKE